MQPNARSIFFDNQSLKRKFRRFRLISLASVSIPMKVSRVLYRIYFELPGPFRSAQMQGAPEDDTGSVHGRTLRMAAEEQRRR